MGFFRQQEERMAVRLLTWQYQRLKIALPSEDELEARAVALVDEAHRIARDRGRNVLSIMKELVGDLRKK
ncbi:MAG: hypothetical protein NWQ21_01585 [Desulfobacterales bacterium]|nr:hypothetical protein [Desulfobacterales bacterium]